MFNFVNLFFIFSFINYDYRCNFFNKPCNITWLKTNYKIKHKKIKKNKIFDVMQIKTQTHVYLVNFFITFKSIRRFNKNTQIVLPLFNKFLFSLMKTHFLTQKFLFFLFFLFLNQQFLTHKNFLNYNQLFVVIVKNNLRLNLINDFLQFNIKHI